MRVPRSGVGRRALLRCLGIVILGTSGSAISDSTEPAHSQADLISIGRQIYRSGLLPSGGGLVGLSHGDIPVSGSLVACTNCHRRSGLGSSEGGKVVPPVTVQALFDERTQDQREAFRSRSLRSRMRPAYDLDSLARVLRSGIDSGGNELDLLMPRYELGDTDIEALAAYLRTLNFQTTPGLTATDLHFATIVARNADEINRRSVLEILNRFVTDKNAGTRNESKRASRGAFYRDFMDDSYRKWRLHVWELEGSPDTWGTQLEALYAAQPVFALMGGTGKGSWRPVHEFCQTNEVPCIFPITDQPVPDEDFYSIYLSGGIAQAARAVAENMDLILQTADSPSFNPLDRNGAASVGTEKKARVVQVYRHGSAGGAMAKTIRTLLEDSEWSSHDHVIQDAGAPSVHFWRTLYAEQPNSILFVWLSAEDMKNFAESGSGGLTGRPELVLLSETISGPDAFASPQIAPTRVVSLFELREGRDRSLQRLRAWLKPRGLQPTNDRIQADSYLAVTLMSSAVKHMRRNFSREYMIEIIEHGLDNSVFRSVYPRLTLGPNQRFASKGAYILRPSDTDPENWIPIGETRAH